MLVCFKDNGKEKEVINTYSGYDSAINGFSSECRKRAKEKGVDVMDIAGKELFLMSMNFICQFRGRHKKCGSIKELENWIKTQKTKQTGGENTLQNLDVMVQWELIPEEEAKIIIETITQPVAFVHAKVKNRLVKEVFDKKTKNWMVDLE